jgi:hypothetical protein
MKLVVIAAVGVSLGALTAVGDCRVQDAFPQAVQNAVGQFRAPQQPTFGSETPQGNIRTWNIPLVLTQKSDAENGLVMSALRP